MTEKRQRQIRLSARFNAKEAAAVRERADKAGQSVGALLRHTLLNAPLPASRHRPSVNHQAVARLLAELAKIRAELGKSGSNLNQLAHYAHLDRHQSSSITVALQEHEQCIRSLEEMRLACMQALGFERERSPDKDD